MCSRINSQLLNVPYERQFNHWQALACIQDDHASCRDAAQTLFYAPASSNGLQSLDNLIVTFIVKVLSSPPKSSTRCHAD